MARVSIETAVAGYFIGRTLEAGHDLPRRLWNMVDDEVAQGEMMDCQACGMRWPTSLIDAKPNLLSLPQMIRQRRLYSTDFERMECPICYGPGWSCM